MATQERRAVFLICFFEMLFSVKSHLAFAQLRQHCLVRQPPSPHCHCAFASVTNQNDWRDKAERLRRMFVDPYYRNIPIRPSTVEKASEYLASYPADDETSCGIFPGRHAYLGGAKDERDGCIYGIPSHARSTVCLYPSLNENGGYKVKTIPLPKSVAAGKFKWLRGILVDGYLYGIPAWANCVLQVDIDALWKRRKAKNNDIVKLLPLPESYKGGDQQWQWHGAALNEKGTAIYCIPSNAKEVLKVDLGTFTTSLIDIEIPEQYTDFDLDLTNKWYGGIRGKDNAVYGVPYKSGSVLRIDTETDTATLVGPDFGSGKWNWHGGIEANGSIYAFPSHANSVLKIDTTNASRGQDCRLLPIPRAPNDTVQNYKWLGGSLGLDGNIYGMPCDASSILKIDVETNECTTFGDTGDGKSKWQGAVLARDGCVYAIPSYGRHVLRIDTNPTMADEESNEYQLLGHLPFGKSKYQGGFVGNGGSIYCIPENGYRVLRVTPPENEMDVVSVDML
jgi:hypothetical protein